MQYICKYVNQFLKNNKSFYLILSLPYAKTFLYTLSMTRNCFKTALKATIPVFLGYIVCGIAFGLMVINAGYKWWLATFMSVFMFAGAAQFAAIPLFASGASLPVIVFTELLLNIRHIVYGLPLINQFKKCRKIRPYLIFGLTDETFSLLTTVPVPENESTVDFFGAITAFDHFYWIAGSTLGALIGTLIPFDLTGVDFALTALFAVLTVEQVKKYVRK